LLVFDVVVGGVVEDDGVAEKVEKEGWMAAVGLFGLASVKALWLVWAVKYEWRRRE
jgi:hypothetical protein